MKKGWRVALIGEEFKTVTGNTPSKKRTEYYGDSLPFVKPPELVGGWIDEASDSLSESGATVARVLPIGSILVSCIGNLGKIGITGIPVAFNQQINAILPDNAKAVPMFLFYCMLSPDFQQQLRSQAAGTTVPIVNKSKFNQIFIPLPPLPEQKRIVAILDEAFAGIDKAVANAEKNLANARELFESHLNTTFSQKGDGWEEKRLEQFASSVSTGPFGSLLHKADYVSDGVPLVNPINIVGEAIVPDGRKQVGVKVIQRLQSYTLREGDIVIARRGEIGRCAVVTDSQSGWICGTGCFFIRPLPSVNPVFLARLIRSIGYREELKRMSTGTTMKNLSNKTLCALRIALPDISHQIDILGQLDSLSTETQRLESIYQQKLDSLAELKQSILQKAFWGELTEESGKVSEEITK